ncbi:MAG: polysaccharide biosynthesis/export family protein [Gammaproteobacteria bacterium]
MKGMFTLRQSWKLCIFAGFLAMISSAQAQQEYKLNAGDILLVSVWKEEELTREVLVRPDGGISFPLVGEVQAAGRSTRDVQDSVVAKLSEYVPDAVVTVAVLSTNGNKVYVLGKVARPGEYVVNKRLDVMQVLALAGGLTTFAAENKVRILRRSADGTQKAIPFRYGAVKEGAQLDTNIVLVSGDTVVVP